MGARRRVFLIALPVAFIVALWAGPGLAPDDGESQSPIDAAPAVPPVLAPPIEPAVDAPPETPRRDLECEEPRDPGPDGDG